MSDYLLQLLPKGHVQPIFEPTFLHPDVYISELFDTLTYLVKDNLDAQEGWEITFHEGHLLASKIWVSTTDTSYIVYNRYLSDPDYHLTYFNLLVHKDYFKFSSLARKVEKGLTVQWLVYLLNDALRYKLGIGVTSLEDEFPSMSYMLRVYNNFGEELINTEVTKEVVMI